MKKRAICGICPDKCWVEVEIEDCKIVKVAPDNSNPFGRLCPRGALAHEIIYSNKRILKPLIRTGERGEGKFRQTTWDEALDLASSNFLEIKEKIAMLKIIVETERYDKQFVKNWTSGFDEFSKYLKSVTLQDLSHYCGVPVDKIKQLTDLFCSTEKACYFSYTGIEYQLSAVQNCRAVHILWALTGKLDVKGGMLINKGGLGVYPLAECRDVRRIGEREFPFFSRMLNTGQFSLTPKAVLEDDPYAVRGFYFAAASPMTTYPDKKLWEKVYQKLDFIAVNERFMSEDAKYADVIFPATTYYENASVVNTPAGPAIREKVIDPVGESKNDLHILKALAEKMGFGDAYPEEDDESTLLWMLDGDSEMLANLRSGKRTPVREYESKKWESGHLRADGKPGFPTPTGKFEISSTYIKECGYVGYPVYKDIRSVYELGDSENYPMMMTTGARSRVRFASFGPNIPEIAKIEPAPLVDIGKTDAMSLNIAQGDWAQVETVFGKKAFRANVCEMMSGCIHVPFGGGSSFMPDAWETGNINEICSLDFHDELSGFLLYKSMPCKVSKAQGADLQ